jgi:hypothetical protein
VERRNHEFINNLVLVQSSENPLPVHHFPDRSLCAMADKITTPGQKIT